RHERVLELPQGRILALAVLVPQLLDLELAQRVVEVRRVVGPAARLLVGGGRFLKTLLDEDLRSVLDGHALRVKLDTDDVPAIAKERLLKLSQADLRVAAAETLVHRHLLGVVGPSFRVRAAEEELPRLGREARRVEKLEVMTGPDLVHVDHRDDV